MKSYFYDGKKYLSEKSLRDAIFKKDKKLFCKAPVENEAEFWKKHNVVFEEHELSLDAQKEKKKSYAKMRFNMLQNSATLRSSLGFEIDATEKSRNSIDDLIDALRDGETVKFRDAHNEYHELTVEQLRVLKSEIAQNNIYAYEQKWAIEQKIKEATNKEELRVICTEFFGKVFE